MRHPSIGRLDADWKNIRILVFGQDDQFRFLARQTFRKLMVRDVTPYSEAAETSGLLNRGFDLLLVDLASDPRHGLVVIETLRQSHPVLPVLVVAPSSLAGDIDRAKALGIEGTIPKPVSGHELSHRVAETLANPQRMAAPVSTPAPAATVPGPTAPASAAPPSAGRGFAAAGADMPVRKTSGGDFGDDDPAPVAAKPAGGRLDDGDLAGRPFDAEAAARRKAAQRRRRAWLDEMAQSGKPVGRGKDVAGLDISAIVAEHGRWLGSKGAEGKRAAFTGMDLAGADLAGTLLPNASFREVNLSDACLADARLDGSDFRHAVMEAADLGGADLGVAAMRHARLRLSNLEGASLRGSDLSGAVLSGAKTAGADFKGAILVGADLSGADLSRAEGLTQAQVEKTLCDLDTRLPPGLSRPAKPE